MKIEDVFASRYLMRKNMICVGKAYSKKSDGPFDYDDKHFDKMYSRKDRTYLRYRIKDEFSRRYGCAGDVAMYDVPTRIEDKYLVVCFVKRSSKKHAVLFDMGFVTLAEAR